MGSDNESGEDQEMMEEEEEEAQDEVVSEQDSIVSDGGAAQEDEPDEDEEPEEEEDTKPKKKKHAKSDDEGQAAAGSGEEDGESSKRSMRNDSRSQSSSCIQTRRSKYVTAAGGDEDHEMRSQSSMSTQGGNKKEDKKHKKKKKKKDKDKKKKKKKDKKKKKKKKRGSSTTSDSSNSSDSSGDWKFDDKGVVYGSPERLSEGSSDWDGRSQELYDSDSKDTQLNLYHKYSKPRILEIEDFNEDGDPCRLALDCLTIPDEEESKAPKKKDKMTYQERKREQEANLLLVDHKEYQNQKMHGEPQPLVLHNMISQDFVRGVAKNLTCPICQEMVNNPVIYKSCLHRFCNTCIESYNRLGKKECPLCRKQIGNRRQLRPDKNIQALMDTLKYDFIKLQKQEELENQEIKRKIIQEQKQLRDRKEKQKRVVNNEMRRKFAETQEEKKERLQKEREEQGLVSVKKKSKGSAGFGGTDGGVDTNHVIRMIEEKKQNLHNLLLPVDIEITITHDREQNDQYKMMVKRIRLKASRQITLIHLGILVAHKNLCKEDEWPNYEFYPGASFKDHMQKTPDALTNYKDNGRPFKFKMSIYDIVKELYPGQEDNLAQIDMIYKKKQMPNMNPKLSNIVKTPLQSSMSGIDSAQNSYMNQGGSMMNRGPLNPQSFNYYGGGGGGYQGMSMQHGMSHSGMNSSMQHHGDSYMQTH